MKIIITGGAGFIGINTTKYFLKKGADVIIFDNFSRKGSKQNLQSIDKKYIKSLKVIEGDVRYDCHMLAKHIKTADVIIHLAGQVAVTTSVLNPKEDFDINAVGTVNLLEEVRKSGNNPVFIYSSTNKVYGDLSDQGIIEKKNRYAFKHLPKGIAEDQPIDFHSPYGCSKGAADQYVRDYARIYGLKTIVFRQSCIYGPHQFGIEDQGWVAWFIIALTKGKKITIYGNGKQVRDILYVDDLVRAYDLAIKHIKKTRGNIYNVGGGMRNSISIWTELQPRLNKLFYREIKAKFSKIRPGDQPIFISDISKAQRDFLWEPRIGVDEGIQNLFTWVQEHKDLFEM